MAFATTQLQEPFSAMSTSLADEVLLFASHQTAEDTEFHDATEQPADPTLSWLDRLPASLQDL